MHECILHLSLICLWIGPSPGPTSLLLVATLLLRLRGIWTLEHLLLDVLEYFRIGLLHISSSLCHARPEGVWSDKIDTYGVHVGVGAHAWEVKHLHALPIGILYPLTSYQEGRQRCL